MQNSVRDDYKTVACKLTVHERRSRRLSFVQLFAICISPTSDIKHKPSAIKVLRFGHPVAMAVIPEMQNKKSIYKFVLITQVLNSSRKDSEKNTMKS